MKSLRTLSILALSAATLVITGCAAPGGTYNGRYATQPVPAYQNAYPNAQQRYPSGGYANQGYQGYQNNGVYARYAIVQSVRPVSVGSGANTSGVGLVGGAAVGGLLGNQIGKGNGRTAATLLGIVGGGFAGNAIEGSRNGGAGSGAPGLEIQVEMEDSRERLVIVQPDQGQYIRPGTRVRVVENNGQLMIQ